MIDVFEYDELTQAQRRCVEKLDEPEHRLLGFRPGDPRGWHARDPGSLDHGTQRTMFCFHCHKRTELVDTRLGCPNRCSACGCREGIFGYIEHKEKIAMKNSKLAAALLLASCLALPVYAQPTCPEGRAQVVFSGWGQCIDAEEGDLTLVPAAFEWTSDIQGHIADGDAAHPQADIAQGHGYGCLREGEHVLTLRCSDSENATTLETDFGVGGLAITAAMLNSPPVIHITPYGVTPVTPQPGDCYGDDCP